ncbi:MAG: APC family permease [Bdellovibrio sp.]|nr:APC family permease [Bdellovibrio sp.]
MGLSQFKRVFLGQPLSNQMASEELIPKWKALAVLSSDALSSVAYATEEVLIPLAAFSVLAVGWSIPIALAICALLIIITISYRQTIDAYPSGGGAYIVAKENLGTTAGLVAGASLLIDYVLTVAVSIASGVEQLASAFPVLVEHKELCGAFIILLIALFNLRGIRESASIFALPTYLFVVSILVMIGVGAWKVFHGVGLHPVTVVDQTYAAVPLFLILRSFSSGCAALTGVEAISNGIPVFRQPSSKNAKITMLWMSGILGTLFLGITFLSHLFQVMPKADETGVSQLAHAIFGNSWLYYVVAGSTAWILFLAANTSYADFPRLSSLLAKDRYLPRQLASLGDRLVFSNGILGLSAAAIMLLFLFKGETHLLIPLYAIGVFLSFTLSQGGMVRHHLKEKKPGWMRSCFFNGLGAATTLCVLLVIAVTKFKMGAWMVILFIPLLVLVFNRIHIHYLAVGKELSLAGLAPPEKLQPFKHTVIVPISGIHRGVIDALRYSLSISSDVRACYVEIDSAATERMQVEWKRWAHEVPIVVLKSPYRSVIRPLLDYLDDVEQTAHGDVITVIIPEFVTKKWWHQVLHNQTAFVIRAALMFRRGKVVTSVRYHLRGT